MKCVRELKRVLKSLKEKGGISLDDVVTIELRLRQLLDEKGKYKNDYPLVNLFCNWTVHTKLKHSNTIYKYLLSVSQLISNSIGLYSGEDPKEATNLFIQKSGNILQIPELRKSMIEIFQNEGIDTFLIGQKKWWDGFVILLLKELAEKPLQFPEEVIEGKEVKNASKIFEEIKQLPHPNDWDKVFKLEVLEKDNKYHLKFSTLGSVDYIVELLGNEKNDAFIS